ncbi:MAG: DUF2059 domain-containing protein [Nitrospirae bacterium]|nr:DUF2059 domain-containing protein [Candidatus Manganitrophaceae bacterium]
MKNMRMQTILTFTSLLLLSLTSISFADELTAKKKALIDEILSITRASKMGDVFSSFFVQRMSVALKQSKPDIDARAFEILQEEVDAVIKKGLVDEKALNKMSYPIYQKHLDSSDLSELIRFYKTPVGKKFLFVMPMITQEVMQAGQIWGQPLGPIIQKRVIERFEKEKIVYK